MREALVEAAKGEVGLTAPNPRVGAVIVERGRVVARGFFARDGGPHAERVALESLGRAPEEGATVYVTLEPCSTEGRTGACTRRLIEAGIRRVVVGAFDPTPAHRGNAVAVLRAAGIEVQAGVLRDDCEALNPDFCGRTTS